MFLLISLRMKFSHQFLCLTFLHRISMEIEDVLGSRQFVEYKDLGNLQYLGQTLKEGLRLHPPVSGTTRVTTKEENLAGYHIPAGTSVNISWFILHRLSEAWTEPKKFDPDRFSPEAKSPTQAKQFLFFPFWVRGPALGKHLPSLRHGCSWQGYYRSLS